MRKRSHPILFLIVGMLFFALLLTLFFFFSPNSPINLSSYAIPSIPVFFMLIFLTLFFLITYALNSKTQGVLLSLFVLEYLLLRFFHFDNVFFIVLLIALLVVSELFVRDHR